MKKRVKIDSALITLLVLLTFFFYRFPGLFPKSRFVDNGFDLLGFLIVLKGALIRVAARGHKKSLSKQSGGLVKTGLYGIVRHPMYLGSFLMGCGFVFIVWPFWVLPLFMWLFIFRFNKQMSAEERYLHRKFKAEYDEYAQKIPRFFPSLKSLKKLKVKKIFPLDDLKKTPERLLILMWAGIAVVLESIQQWIVFDSVRVGESVALFVGAAVLFTIGLWYRYNEQ